MEQKFPVLDSVREIHVGNKITPTVSIGIACEGDNLEELSQNAVKALDLALGARRRPGGRSRRRRDTVLWRYDYRNC